MEVDVDLPPKLHEAYEKLAPMLRYSDAEFMKRVSCSPSLNN